MNDPFGSMQGFIGQFQNFMRNPIQFFAQRRMNLPQGVDVTNPQQARQIIQNLMNNGQMSQQQFNQLQNMAKQLQNNPMFKNLIQR